MNIIANSIFVDNQEEALQFYTDILGFKKKIDEPVGEGFRWLTLVSPNQPDGAQLVLEPNGNPIAGDYQQRLFEANIPITMFGVENVQQTYDALTQKAFTLPLNRLQWVALNGHFDDTCGNLIQIVEQ